VDNLDDENFSPPYIHLPLPIDLKDPALQITTDPNHKFDLALSLDDRFAVSNDWFLRIHFMTGILIISWISPSTPTFLPAYLNLRYSQRVVSRSSIPNSSMEADKKGVN